MSRLLTKHCQPCEGDIQPFTREEAQAFLNQEIQEWCLNETATEISRAYKFKDYYETMAFVNGVAWIAHQENHHPNLEISYCRCLVRYCTHAINGLSENDFICAAKVDALLSPPQGIALCKP